MKVKKIIVECERCRNTEDCKDMEAFEALRTKGWSDIFKGRTLCPHCSEVMRTIDSRRLIPKESFAIDVGIDSENNAIYEFHCPTCGEIVNLNIHSRHKAECMKCGQVVFNM